MKQLFQKVMMCLLSFFTFTFSFFPFAGCIEPPLKLPAQEVVVEMPLVLTDLEVVWNLDVEWQSEWYYGWDVTDNSLFGPIEYPEPTSFEVRRYYLGDHPGGLHNDVDGFTIFGNRFRRNYRFGYYDMLLWSNIDSDDGTQVLKVDETPEQVTATTSVSRGLTRLYTDMTDQAGSSMVTGLYNQPEIFYSTYPRDIYISHYKEDYDYYDEVEKCWVKHINCSLTPLVYIYLVQVIFTHNDGRVIGTSGNAALTAFASGTSVNTGHTNNAPCIVYYNTRMKKGIEYKGEKVDIIGGKFTTFGLCDMEPYTRATSHLYEGSRTDLPNYALVDITYRNGMEETLQIDVTEQCRDQAHGGIITLVIDCNDLKMPEGPGEDGNGSLFVPTVEDYDEVIYDIPM